MVTRLLGALALLLTLTASLVVSAGTVIETRGARVVTATVASNLTTNTTSAVSGQIPTGYKSIYGEVLCTSGACTQTQALYGATSTTAANGILLCTLVLSGTTRAQDACPPFTANFSFYYVVTTSTTGTAARGAVYAMF